MRLLDAAVSRRNDPRAHIYIDDHVQPGVTVIRHIDVSSSARGPVALKFYADAATVNGGFFVPAPGRGRNDITDWTTVTPSSATVPAGGHVVLTVRIAVPNDVQAGERYAVILAEVPAGAPKPGAVALGARVGIRVYLSVGKGKEPVTDFSVSTLTASRTQQGQPQVKAQVHNTGGRAVDLSGTLTLDHGPGGLRAGPYAVSLGTTLGLGQNAPVSILLDKQLPAGPWHAVLTMHSGPVTRAVEGTITFPAAAGASSPAVPAKAIPLTKRKNVVIPVAGALIGGLAFAFLLFLLLWRRRKKKDDDSGGTSQRPDNENDEPQAQLETPPVTVGAV
ncbi:MAG: hypothetical protein QOG53_1784 [Frankiales bacterium]|nr:hypothetical protein [Frankiales bacterium]